MSIENQGYRSESARGNPSNRKKNTKRGLIGGGIFGAATAAWLAFGGSGDEKPRSSSDNGVEIKKNDQEAPDDSFPDDLGTPPLFIPELEVPLNEPKLGVSGSALDKAQDGDPNKIIPLELQDHLDELQHRCDEFFDGDAMTVIDPLNRPTVISIIETYVASITSNTDWSKRYSHIANKPYLLDLCGGSDRFKRRAHELATLVLNQSSWPKAKKLEALNWCVESSTLTSHSDEVRKMIDQLHAHASYGDSEEDKMESLTDHMVYYNEIIDTLSKSPEELTSEQKFYCGRILQDSLWYQNRYGMPQEWEESGLWSFEEKKEVKKLVREYFVIPSLAESFRNCLHVIDNPPENPSDWRYPQSTLVNDLGVILRDMKEYDIQPSEIGSDYSTAELEAILKELGSILIPR